MALYEPPPDEPRVSLGVRVPTSTRTALEAVIRLWRTYARARNDETDQIDLSYAIRRLLRTGTEAAFREFGIQGVPQSEADWTEVERAILKSVGISSIKLKK
jgi:hypothetical protein